MKLKVLYRCSCMQDEGTIEMLPRGEHESIEEFMARLQMNLGIDHAARNPLCRAVKVEHVKIPYVDGKPVGSLP